MSGTLTAKRVNHQAAREHFMAGGSLVIERGQGKRAIPVTPESVLHSKATTTWPALAEQMHIARQRDNGARWFAVQPPIDGPLPTPAHTPIEMWSGGFNTNRPTPHQLVEIEMRPVEPNRHHVDVVVIRDPDASNDYAVYIDGIEYGYDTNPPVIVRYHDIDPGSSGVDQEWVDGWFAAIIPTLPPAVARRIIDSVSGYAESSEYAEDDIRVPLRTCEECEQEIPETVTDPNPFHAETCSQYRHETSP